MERPERIKYLAAMNASPCRLLLPALAAIFLSLGCERAPTVYVPTQPTAQAQYAYAINYRNQHELLLRNRSKKEQWERTRAAVREAFQKVVELYPEDRNVTPLARMELADMRAGLDLSGVEPSESDLEWAINELQQLQRDYPTFDFIQAKARYDEALCWKELERYDRSQVLFKEVIDTFSTHKDPVIQGIVERSNIFYQRVYVK